LENDPLWLNFQNSVPKVFTALPIDVAVFNCCKICPTGHCWHRALFTSQKNKNKNSVASQTVDTGRSRTQFAWVSLQHSAHNVPNFIEIGSLSKEL